jgi:hypothetical protein
VIAEAWGFRLMFDLSGFLCVLGFLVFAFMGKEAGSGDA